VVDVAPNLLALVSTVAGSRRHLASAQYTVQLVRWVTSAACFACLVSLRRITSSARLPVQFLRLLLDSHGVLMTQVAAPAVRRTAEVGAACCRKC